VIDPERADTCHDRLRYDVRRIKGSTDSYLEDRRVNLEKAEEKGQLSNQISLNCRIHLFLQEDVEGHDSEIPEVGWLLRCTRVRSLAAAKKQSASRKRSKSKKTTHFRIRFEFVPYFPEVLCKEILLDRFPIDTNSFSHCYHVR